MSLYPKRREKEQWLAMLRAVKRQRHLDELSFTDFVRICMKQMEQQMEQSGLIRTRPEE
jgi:hypothetical protein